jgi:hypothetical protein
MWSRSVAGAVEPQVCVQVGCARAKSAFWLSLYLVHRLLPCKVWDVVGASHSFLNVFDQHPRLYVRYLPPALLRILVIYACISLLLVFLLGCRRLCFVLACGSSYAPLCSLRLLCSRSRWCSYGLNYAFAYACLYDASTVLPVVISLTTIFASGLTRNCQGLVRI